MPIVRPKPKPKPEVLPGVRHPLEKYLRTDRLPHIWCSGCGLGIALSSFL